MESTTAKKIDAEEPQLTIERLGHRRWLVVKEGEFKVRCRLPLHVDKMNDAQKEFFMHNACIELKSKLNRMRGLGQLIN